MRLGVATVLLYMAEGAMGFPVFQSTPEKGIGIAYMLGSTGGYLAGFVVMAAIVGWAADRGWDRHPIKLFNAMLVGEIVMMAMGFAWLALLIGPEKSWQFGVLPFIVGGSDQGCAGREPGAGRLVADLETLLTSAKRIVAGD